MTLQTVGGEVGTHAPLQALRRVRSFDERGQIIHVTYRCGEITGIAHCFDLIQILRTVNVRAIHLPSVETKAVTAGR